MSVYTEKSSIKGFAYLFIAILFWGTLELVIKFIQANTSAITINFFRWFFGAIFFLGYIIASKKLETFKLFLKLYPKYYIPSALLGLTLGMLTITFGNIRTDASIAATIISSNPILLSSYMVLFQGEKRSKKKIMGILVGFFGVLVIITQFQFTAFFKSENFFGNILVFIGTLFWVIHLIIGKILLGKEPIDENLPSITHIDFNAATFLIAGIGMVPFLFLPGEFSTILNYNWKSWIGVIYIGLFVSGVAYLFFFKGLQMMEASKGINVFYFKPIIATILAILLLGESPTIFLFIGIAIEILALYLVS